MITTIEQNVYEQPKNRRKKIWEVGAYNCAILGTCLNRSEVRKIASRKKFGLPSTFRDHELHSALVNLSGTRCEESRALQQILDKKYKSVVNRFSRVKTEESVRLLWEEYLQRGSLAGPFWAVMTHPATGKELAADAHGELHMIGHDFTEIHQRDKSEVYGLRSKVQCLEDMLALQREEFLKTKDTLDEKSGENLVLDKELERLNRENVQLREKLEESEKKQGKEAGRGVILGLTEEISRLKDDKRSLKAETERLRGEADDLQELFELASDSVQDLELTNVALVQDKADLKREVENLEATLEGTLQLGLTVSPGNCATCSCSEEECPGVNLCGKTVLYVGGHHKMIPRYRELVEKYNGNFIHHDGGRETSKSILPKVLSRADAVLCPIDCISHDACKCVKKMCKKYQKDYVMMRTSGLSSLARGLTEITEVAASN